MKPELEIEAVAKAKELITAYRGGRKKWPEDEWFSLNDDWDLNIYRDEDRNQAATMFPVVDGNTITDCWKELNVKNVMEEMKSKRKADGLAKRRKTLADKTSKEK